MSAINNYYSKIPQNYYQIQRTQTVPTFGADSAVLNQPPKPKLSNPVDTVEISEINPPKKSKEKLSTATKVGIAALGLIGGFTAIGICGLKHQTNKLTKLYNEKMQLVNLAEHIDFKEAKTVEEGIKFAKDVLKIGEVEGIFTLDAINYANRGLVDISNANKGHLFMPKKIGCKSLKNAMAYVQQDVKSPNFGELVINKKYFENESLDKAIKEWLGASKPAVKPTAQRQKFVPECRLDARIKNLTNKFLSDPNSLTIAEKRDVYYTLCNAGNVQRSVLSLAPMSSLKKNLKTFTDNGINVDVDTFSKLTTKEQSKKLNEYFLQIQNKGTKVVLDIPYLKPEKTIYHEMGHLQDFAKNLKELDLKHWKLPSFKECYNKARTGRKHIDKSSVEHVDNRWGGLTYKGYKELFENDPAKFKKRYPDLYEFLTNQDYQQAAGEVSSYAQTSIGEFIAETYAKMVRGDKISDEVMKLYEKYNGPKLGG